MQQSTYMNAELGAEFAALLDSHRRLVFKVAHTYARGPADVEDLAQEIATPLWRALTRMLPMTSWLARTGLGLARVGASLAASAAALGPLRPRA